MEWKALQTAAPTAGSPRRRGTCGRLPLDQTPEDDGDGGGIAFLEVRVVMILSDDAFMLYVVLILL